MTQNPAPLARRAVLLGATLLPGAAAAQGGMLRGTATYRERIALPPGAMLEVVLEETSRADAPATRIAEARIPVQGQVPIAFALPFDLARIEPHLTYAVRATLSRDGRVLFRTDRIHQVLTRGAGDSVELLLVRAAAATTEVPPALAALAGPRWIATAIGGAASAPGVVSDITFTTQGDAYGTGGCNRFRGGFTLQGADGVTFGQLASTMMACDGAPGEQEGRFHAALAAVRRWRIEGEALLLLDAGGATVLRLRRAA